MLLAFVTACQYRSEKDMVTGSWKYVSITKQDSSVIEISDNDYLQLNTDSSFQYRIHSIDKNMKGSWFYSGHALHLHYMHPDTTRHFQIDILTKYKLDFHEGDMVFKFTRID